MRVAVVDIGTNSTRLLIADVEDGRVTRALKRRSEVTRLGAGVDATGRLGDEAIARVLAVLDEYRKEIDTHDCDVSTAVLTSAVRDARNGADFTQTVRERYGLDARVIDGDEEALLTFTGATDERDPDDPTELLVVDVGGGSTELVLGAAREVHFQVSTQSGVVRQTERHLHDDPPRPEQLEALAAEVRGIIAAAVPADVRSRAREAIAVAGTATSCAAIAQELEPYDPDRVHGHLLTLAELETLLARLAALPLERRRETKGLHPDRAPTIVAGILILMEALEAFGLDRAEVSEHDILRGAALHAAQRAER